MICAGEQERHVEIEVFRMPVPRIGVTGTARIAGRSCESLDRSEHNQGFDIAGDGSSIASVSVDSTAG